MNPLLIYNVPIQRQAFSILSKETLPCTDVIF